METVLFDSPVVKIEAFELAPSQEKFHQIGHIQHPIAVFPKNPIWIKHEGKQSFVADTSLVNFYNQDQVYSRSLIDPRGDYCHCFSLREDILCEQLGHDRSANEMFHFQHLRSSRSAFMLQLGILRSLSALRTRERGEKANILSSTIMTIEEQSLALFSLILDPVSKESHTYKAGKSRLRQKKLVERIKSSLQENISQQLSLTDLAQEHHLSVYHLSRLFKQHCGIGISQYRLQQRLRAASLAILRGQNLTSLALDYGFSSHSHFSASFRHYFGCTPSDFRQHQPQQTAIFQRN
ncbi:MAG: helix-turn-helix transcriptional regulator [Pseudomonadota bacterium]